ncbi:hypothetical protein VTO73DRAFT_3932 [Trametes versicolor]
MAKKKAIMRHASSDPTPWGNTISIQKLPDELLTHIFLLYKQVSKYPLSEHAHRWLRLEEERYGTGPIHCGDGARWTALMLVCRLWREIALASPSLWQSVDVYSESTIKWLELALVRSRDTSGLELFFHNLDAARAALPLILPHTRRLRTLILPPLDQRPAGSGRWDHNASPDVTPFLPLLAGAMPVLEELMISVDHVDHTGRFNRPPLIISASQLPSLRVLRLACVSFVWNADVLSKLTSLDLRACVSGTADDDGPSCDQFLDVLERCESLEDLRLLDKFVFNTLARGAINVGTADPTRTLHLPRLRKLVLADSPRVTKWLLSCLTFPPKAFVSITGWLPVAGVLIAPLQHSAFTDLVSYKGLKDRFFPTTAPTHGSIDVMCESAEISVWTSDGAKLRLELNNPDVREWDAYLPHGLRGFCPLFDSLPIEELTINGFIDNAPEYMDWANLLNQLTKLRTLEVIGRGPVRPLFRALKDTPILDLGDPDLAGPWPPPCDKLTKLSVQYSDYVRGDIELLVAVLHRRAHFGAARMDRVELYMETEDDEDGFAEEMRIYLSELEELCPNISY